MKNTLWLLLFVISCGQASEKIGKTYSVVESDMLADIEKAASETNWKEVMDKDQDKWGAFVGVPLPVATTDNVRRFIPWYSSEFDIRDPRNGKILYPKGFTFNPLEYVSMPFRVLIVSPDQDDWLIANVKPTDQIIYTHGNVLKKTTDLNLQRSVYILNHEIVSQFKLKFTPSIVEQHNKAYQITEVELMRWREEQSK